MDPSLLAAAFLATMGVAVACFWRAMTLRHVDRARHKRWALTGVAIDLLGTALVLVTTKGLGIHVPAAFPMVAVCHRIAAWLATALIFLQAGTGLARKPVHPRLGPIFLGVYTVTYALAVVAYAPWWGSGE